jgi:hypothetical protein
MGRKKKDPALCHTNGFRVCLTDAEKAEMDRICAEQGEELSGWARRILLAEIRHEQTKNLSVTVRA